MKFINMDINKVIKDLGNGQEKHSYYCNDHEVNVITYYKDGIIHRDGDLPAVYHYYETGELKYKGYKIYGIYYREGDEPCKIDFHKDGTIDTMTYFKNGLVHRDNDLPAFISRYVTGALYHVAYKKVGCYHRDGFKPAAIFYDANKIIKEIYYINGVKLSKEDIIRIKRQEILNKL